MMGAGDVIAELSTDRAGSAQPRAPFENYEITSEPVDDDGVALLSPAATVASTDLYFGRLVVDNAIGSELGDVALPWRAEYWDGNTWRIRNDDDCTVIDLEDQVAADQRAVTAATAQNPSTWARAARTSPVTAS